MTEPSGAALSRSRPARVPRRLRRRRSSGSFFIFMDRRLAGPGDLVRDALVGGLAGATPVGTAYFSVQKPGLGMRLKLVVILGDSVRGWVGLCLPCRAGPSGSAKPGCGSGGSGAKGLGSSSGMGLYQISPAGSPLPGAPGLKVASSGCLAPPSTHLRLLGSRLCR